MFTSDSRNPNNPGGLGTAHASGIRKERIRTGHACEPCRRRRAKCNGVRPQCGRCQELHIPCIYAESKAQRHRKEKLLSSKASTYEALLWGLLPQLDQNAQRQVLSALRHEDQEHQESRTSTFSPGGRKDETSARGEAGFLHHQDTSSELSYSEGYLGKSSSVRWLSDIGERFNSAHEPQDAKHHAPTVNPADIEGILIDAANYHVTEFDDANVDEFASHVDLKILPSKHVADEYVQTYFLTVHPFFQVVYKEEFLPQYERFWMTGIPPKGRPLWQAVLNLMLALGCVHARYTGGDPDPVSEMEFFLRARMLSLEPMNFLQVPRREHVQLTAMFAMYFLASNKINRSWLMIGTSVRYAQNLAYYLGNEDDSVSARDRELQVRLWHSVSSLEHILCFLTGRPLSIREEAVSVSLPNAANELSSGSWFPPDETEDDSHSDQQAHHELEAFRRSILLDRILADTLISLYSTRTVSSTWADIQQQITNLNLKLCTWKTCLPDIYGLRETESGPGTFTCHPSKEATCLALRYLSIRILINRPSLCLRPHSKTAMPNQSEHSHLNDLDNFRRAIRAAQRMIRLLKSLGPTEVYDQTPWWCMLHFLVQACALLTMELCDNSEHLPDERSMLLSDAQAGVNILYDLRPGNPAASAAFTSLKRLLEIASTQDRRDIDVNKTTTRTGGRNAQIIPSELNRTQYGICTFNVLNASRILGNILTISPYLNYCPTVQEDSK